MPSVCLKWVFVPPSYRANGLFAPYDCSIARLVERHKATGSVIDRQRPGRERVTTRQQDRYIVLSHLRDRFRTSVETAQETVGTHNLRVSTLTVRRRLQERGISRHKTFKGNVLTPERRISRFNWCRQRMRWTQQRWLGVLFTDELRFCVEMFDRRRKVRRRRGERFQNCCVKQMSRWGGGSVMVWGGISWRDKTQLIIVDGNLTAIMVTLRFSNRTMHVLILRD